jgi:flagellar biosynthesis chaperone FliJ
MTIFRYRLAVLLEQKEEAQRECEKQLAECRAARRAAEAELVRLQALRQQREQTVRDRRAVTLAAGASGEQWQAHAADIAILQQKSEAAKDDVFSQRLHIEDLEQQVTQAAAAWQTAARDVETLRKHRAKCEREFRAAHERKEASEQEEIAAAQFEKRRRA